MVQGLGGSLCRTRVSRVDNLSSIFTVQRTRRLARFPAMEGVALSSCVMSIWLCPSLLLYFTSLRGSRPNTLSKLTSLYAQYCCMLRTAVLLTASNSWLLEISRLREARVRSAIFDHEDDTEGFQTEA